MSSALAQWLQSQDPAFVVGLLATLAAAAPIALFFAVRDLARARLIEDTPTIKIRAVHQGYAEIEGHALAHETPLKAPLSGLPCVWYRYQVQQKVRDTRGRERWQTVDYGASDAVFRLADNTGELTVDPAGADVYPQHRDRWHGDHGRLHLQAALAARLSQPLAAYRYTEERINERDPVYALGLVKNARHHHGDTPLHAAMGDILRGWKEDRDTLLKRFDLDGDGKIDVREWELARQQARREAEAGRRQDHSETDEPVNILCASGDRTRPFIISNRPQTHLLRRHRWRALALFAAAGASGWGAVWIVSLRLLA